jgi:asparagine synthetase B (glutamine-hydrolysing)
MCGIVGCFGKDIHPESARTVIGSMIQAIAHRGPDEKGQFLEPGVGAKQASHD